MTPHDDRAMWRNRFILMNLARIAGTVVVLVGLLVWQGDLAREGGWPLVGIPMVAVGLVASFGAPKALARKWRTPPVK